MAASVSGLLGVFNFVIFFSTKVGGLDLLLLHALLPAGLHGGVDCIGAPVSIRKG